jgi:hypothetical protein
MDHPESYTVTETNGPRPAGKPDQCFYCHRPIGQNHADDCVLRKRTVVMVLEIEVLVEVDQHRAAGAIERGFNEGTWCMDNALEGLENARRTGMCLCDLGKLVFLREATPKDEKRHNYKLEDI